jgi:hypothetical protein
MSRFAYLLIPLGALLSGCPSHESICKSGVDQVCERNFECRGDQIANSSDLQKVFGTSVSDCKNKLDANPLAPFGQQGIACDQVKSDQDLCTNLGLPDKKDFDVGNASDCRDRRADLSCQAYLDQLSDQTKAPPVCNQRCK